MPKNDLMDLINDIQSINIQSNMNNFLMDEIDELIASALKEIGIRQIMDTSQARSIFIDIAREHLGIDFSTIFTDVTDIWGNLERGRDAYNFKPYDIIHTNLEGKSLDVTLYDYGVIGQEEGIEGKIYPSPSRPDRNDYRAGHITTVSEMVESGNLAGFEFWVNRIESKIIDRLEGK